MMMNNEVHPEILMVPKELKDEILMVSLIRDFREDKVACPIVEGLFLGSCRAAADKEGLKRLNITHILTVANAISPAHPHDFTYKIIDVKDMADTDLAKHFSECFDFIDEANRMGCGVLVHCFAGKSRSVTVVVAYLMKRHGMSLNQAMNHVRARRPKATPNVGFYKQLINFEKSLQASGEHELKIRVEGSRGIINLRN
ncbi:hypothetical protein Dimus_004819 [Dionaea muscipula]